MSELNHEKPQKYVEQINWI